MFIIYWSNGIQLIDDVSVLGFKRLRKTPSKIPQMEALIKLDNAVFEGITVSEGILNIIVILKMANHKKSP
ncbi:MAG: hypothetical protein ROZ36_14795 [Thermincola sp.]|jgi:hypothetical protein|nr:hypothetical protein [Thermincola sp.]